MSNKLALYFIILFSFLSPSHSIADHDGSGDHSHQSKARVNSDIPASEVIVNPGESVIIVHGIVCSFCSQGVTRKLSKLNFINPAKYSKGVKVEIEQQKVTIAIKDGFELNLEEVFKAITSGGYEPIEAYFRDEDGQIVVRRAEDLK